MRFTPTDPYRFFGVAAALAGMLGCIYSLLTYFSGTSGCVLADVFTAGCTSTWMGASPIVIAVLVGVSCLFGSVRAKGRGKPVVMTLNLLYASTLVGLYLEYLQGMAGVMH